MDLDDLRARLESELPRLGAAEDVPGVSVAVALGASVVEATWGVVNSRTRAPVTADALFQIQSVTKVLTAALVLQLVDEGRVQLDQPVVAYLPEFRTADRAASAQVTVRQLLTHTGGFEGDLWAPTTSGPDALQRFVSDLVSEAEQHSRPGARFSYCNAGFGTLGRLVEVMRDMTYEQAVRRFLTEPLGIDDVAFSADQGLAFRTAIGHVRPVASAPLRPTREWGVMPPSNPAAGNQLAMSARSLLSLGRIFIAGGRSSTGAPVLSRTAVDLMLRPHFQHPGTQHAPTHQGLGWRLVGAGVAEHTGGSLGIASLLRMVPANSLAAVVLTNADGGAALARRLLDPLFRSLADVPVRASVRPPEPHERVTDARPYLGRYLRRQALLEVSQDVEGRLWLVQVPRHESVVMAGLAGVPSAAVRHEIRQSDADMFVLVDGEGRGVGTVTFEERDGDGRFRFVLGDRAARREDD